MAVKPHGQCGGTWCAQVYAAVVNSRRQLSAGGAYSPRHSAAERSSVELGHAGSAAGISPSISGFRQPEECLAQTVVQAAGQGHAQSNKWSATHL